MISIALGVLMIVFAPRSDSLLRRYVFTKVTHYQGESKAWLSKIIGTWMIMATFYFSGLLLYFT